MSDEVVAKGPMEDDNAGLPPVIREQVKRVDAMMAEAAAKENTGDEPALEAEPAADPQPDPIPAAEVKADTGDTPPTPTPEPLAEPDWKVKYEELNARHAPLQGKYNAEVPRLHEQLKQLESEKAALFNLLKEGQLPASTPEPERDLTKELGEKYGDEDLASTVAEMIRSEAAAAVKPLAAEAAQDRMDRYNSELNSLIPDLQAIRNDPEFSSFLAVTDPMAPASRRELLVHADNAKDPRGVAQFYDAFRTFQQPVAAPVTPAAPAPAPKSMEEQVAPGRSVTPAPTSATKKRYTKKEMDRLLAKSIRPSATEADNTACDKYVRDYTKQQLAASSAEG